MKNINKKYIDLIIIVLVAIIVFPGLLILNNHILIHKENIYNTPNLIKYQTYTDKESRIDILYGPDFWDGYGAILYEKKSDNSLGNVIGFFEIKGQNNLKSFYINPRIYINSNNNFLYNYNSDSIYIQIIPANG